MRTLEGSEDGDGELHEYSEEEVAFDVERPETWSVVDANMKIDENDASVYVPSMKRSWTQMEDNKISLQYEYSNLPHNT